MSCSDSLPDAAICTPTATGASSSAHGALLPEGVLHGRRLAELYTVEDADAGRPAADLERAARHGAVVAQAFRVAPTAARFWARSVLTALHDADGAGERLPLVLRDMSEHGRAEQALRGIGGALSRGVGS